MANRFETKDYYNFYDFVEIIELLRAPGGCPWDAEQTHESIKKNLIEETYEVIEAINKGDEAMLCEELGDLLMQVVFHAQMEAEKKSFNIDDVADGVCKKLVERHPHIFGETDVNKVSEVLYNWEAIKRKTKGHTTTGQSLLSVPKELPALMRSSKVQNRAADCGFDWPDVNGAIQKLDEEVLELKSAIADKSAENMQEELGDVLFSAVNISRFLQLDPEETLTEAVDKFINRFIIVEELAEKEGIDIRTAGLEKLNLLWDVAKLRKE